MEFYKETKFQTTKIGRFPADWKIDSLPNVFNIIDYRGKTPPFSEKGIPYVGADNIRNEQIIMNFNRFVTEATYKKYMKREIPKAEDILFTTEAPLGEVALVPYNFKFCIAQRVIALSCKNKHQSSAYFMYMLRSGAVHHQLIRWATGTTAHGIASKNSKFIRLPFSDNIVEQIAIAKILSAVSFEIKQTDSIIKKTQELKKGLMQRLLTKGIGHKEFKYSEELGCEIPKEWEALKLGEILSLEYGEGLTEKQRKGGKYPVYGSNGIIGYHSDYLVKGPGIIVGRKGTIGAVTWTDDCFWPIDTTYYVALKKPGIGLKWLFYKLKSMDLFELNMATGVPGLNRELAYSVNISFPLIHEQQKITLILTDIDKKIEEETETRSKLEALKKGLMQILLTGQVRIKVN